MNLPHMHWIAEFRWLQRGTSWRFCRGNWLDCYKGVHLAPCLVAGPSCQIDNYLWMKPSDFCEKNDQNDRWNGCSTFSTLAQALCFYSFSQNTSICYVFWFTFHGFMWDVNCLLQFSYVFVIFIRVCNSHTCLQFSRLVVLFLRVCLQFSYVFAILTFS